MTATTKHQQIAVAEILGFVAEYKNRVVTIEDTNNGKAEVRGYFGQTWTHGGYADVTTKTVPICELENIKAILADGREITPAEYKMLDAEHPVDQAQRIEKEIGAELPYQRDLKRWEHRIVFAPQKSEGRLKWEADYRQKRAEHRAGFVKQFYGGR